MWYWCKSPNYSIKEVCKEIGLQKKIVIDWYKKIREFLYLELNTAPPMACEGNIVQVDESLFRGKRKSHRCRLLAGELKVKETQLDQIENKL